MTVCDFSALSFSPFTGVEKEFCVLQFAKCESIVMVQRQFRTQYHKDPPTDKPIRTGYNNFEQTGSLSAGKRAVGPAKFCRMWT